MVQCAKFEEFGSDDVLDARKKIVTKLLLVVATRATDHRWYCKQHYQRMSSEFREASKYDGYLNTSYKLITFQRVCVLGAFFRKPAIKSSHLDKKKCKLNQHGSKRVASPWNNISSPELFVFLVPPPIRSICRLNSTTKF